MNEFVETKIMLWSGITSPIYVQIILIHELLFKDDVAAIMDVKFSCMCYQQIAY